MKARLQEVTRDDISYDVLVFVCPGCVAARPGSSGIHMLPVNVKEEMDKASWEWDGNLELPTLSPSILTMGSPFRCHSFLKAGIFEFLQDSEHPLTGQKVLIPDLPKWAESIS